MSREEWLRHAVELIDEQIFNKSLELEYHKDFQIACGWTRRPTVALGETIYPYEGEDVSIDDFFPVTIHINCTIKDPIEMIEVLVHECIHAFKGIKGHGKQFAEVAREVGFEKPYTKNHPSQFLVDNCTSIYNQLKEKYGDFPGKAIVMKPQEKKEGQKRIIMLFCPACGMELKADRKMFEKHGQKCPTCSCGARMAVDLSDEPNPED